MSQELPEGTVTVLFTDVVGSTDLTTSRGAEAAQEIMRAPRDLTRQKVEEHSGHEVKGLGDGFMVAFASARKAVACGVGIQRALEEHNRSQPLDEQVRVHIGLNTGVVRVRKAIRVLEGACMGCNFGIGVTMLTSYWTRSNLWALSN